MLGISHYAPSFDGTDRRVSPSGRSARRSAAPFWPAATAVGTIFAALREGLAAHRRYETLRSRGVPHDTALREALGIGPGASHEVRETAEPIYFAGRA